MKRVLFADNDARFLNARAQFLQGAGYEVLYATTLKDAERLLSAGRVHLAILDLRLVNDTDERDKSGLELAKQEAFRHIPKIILTKFPTYEDVREALGLGLNELPPAVRFVAKQEGSDALILAIEETFERYVKANLDLKIERNERKPITFPALVASIDSGAQSEAVTERAAALQTLFLYLFYQYDHIRLNEILWQRAGRVALTIDAFGEDKPRDSFIVVCGEESQLLRESSLLDEFAPSRATTLLSRSIGIPPFRANAYTIAGADVEDVRPLIDLYGVGPDKTFAIALAGLFEGALAEWHQRQFVLREGVSIEGLYRKRLGLKKDNPSRKQLANNIRAIIQHAATLGLIVQRSSNGLAFRFGGISYEYPDPANIIYQDSTVGQPLLSIKTPGTLTGDNILVDSSGNTWLTDFSEAGLAPTLWNHVQMEAAIRFDWVECKDFQALHDMELCLDEGEFRRFDVGYVEPPLRKPLRVIQHIRRLASPLVGDDPSPYHLGVFFHAVSRIAELNPMSHVIPNEIARLGHVLIAAVMIASRLGDRESLQSEKPLAEELGVRIDSANRRVWVNGRRLALSRQGYQLLCAFQERPNEVLTRQELGVRVFGEKYKEKNASDINRLNTAISRLRDRIEYDPKHPRLLVTEPGGGYRLLTLE